MKVDNNISMKKKRSFLFYAIFPIYEKKDFCFLSYYINERRIFFFPWYLFLWTVTHISWTSGYWRHLLKLYSCDLEAIKNFIFWGFISNNIHYYKFLPLHLRSWEFKGAFISLFQGLSGVYWVFDHNYFS